ncbi:MAG: hypothetical protein JNM56_08560 [Planctomycetia bacterium]|nr:hypothetical protein [Planctomycetia bacterium]
MSIIRVGLSESKKFAEGYDAIFGNKKKPAEEAPKAKAEAKGEKKKGKKGKKS